MQNLLLRNKKLSGDRSTDFEVFKDFINSILKKKEKLPEYIVHLRPTTIRKNSILNIAIKTFLNIHH